uniref:Uncharacterized protein n=1 Tax=Timema genevievae TaxID=629358 RepID=A0A7R9PLP7_TIMGE|nr:unnamed protein product [Timema genevievae]
MFPDGNTYQVSKLTGDVKQKHYATTAQISQLKSWGNKDKIDDGEPVSDESEDDRSNGPELRTTKPDSSPVTFSDSYDGETGRDQNNPRIRPIRERRQFKYLKDFVTGAMLARLVVAKEKQDTDTLPTELRCQIDNKLMKVDNMKCQKMFDPQSYVAKWKEMGAMASVVLSSSDSPDVESDRQSSLHSFPCVGEWDYTHCAWKSNLPLLVHTSGGAHVLLTVQHKGRSPSLPAQNPKGPAYSTALHKEPRPEIRAPPFCQRHHSSAIKLTAPQSPTHFWAATSDLEPADLQTSPRGRSP